MGAAALTRFVVLRLLGVVYLMAFLTWVFQGPALVGAHGLLPTGPVFDQVALNAGSRLAAFWEAPSLFWLLGHGDAVLFGAGWVGVALAAAVMLGYANVPILVVLWALQISIADALRNAGADHVADGGPAKVMEEPGRTSGFVTGPCPRLAKLDDGLAVPVEDVA